jgi:hypothetical protein
LVGSSVAGEQAVGSTMRDLIKAAALIVAEIERLDRLSKLKR